MQARKWGGAERTSASEIYTRSSKGANVHYLPQPWLTNTATTVTCINPPMSALIFVEDYSSIPDQQEILDASTFK